MGHLVEILVPAAKLPVDCSMLSAAMSKGHGGGHEQSCQRKAGKENVF
jgi:hypothetical protein